MDNLLGNMIAPSLLSADFGQLAREIEAVEAAGADVIHVDVMDGHFVPNITIGPPVVRALRKLTDLPLDVHLMIAEPDRYLEEFSQAGADWLTVHVETCPHLHRTVHRIRELGCRPGVVLNPATSLTDIDEIITDVDLVMLMSVNPGFGGQSFIRGALDKIRRLRRLLAERNLEAGIEVDGGVGPGNVAEVAAAGANIFVAGSAVFGQPDYAAVIAKMKEACRQAGRSGGE